MASDEYNVKQFLTDNSVKRTGKTDIFLSFQTNLYAWWVPPFRISEHPIDLLRKRMNEWLKVTFTKEWKSESPRREENFGTSCSGPKKSLFISETRHKKCRDKTFQIVNVCSSSWPIGGLFLRTALMEHNTGGVMTKLVVGSNTQMCPSVEETGVSYYLISCMKHILQ